MQGCRCESFGKSIVRYLLYGQGNAHEAAAQCRCFVGAFPMQIAVTVILE